MTKVLPWDARMTYQTGSHVLHAGRSWIARRWSCGEVPGDSASDSPTGAGVAWHAIPERPEQVGKATMAESLDERIGRGL